MVQVVYGTSEDFDALIYGANHPTTIQYLQNQATNFSQTLTDAGRNFISSTQHLFEKLNGSDAMRLARAALRKAGSAFQRDEVRSIWEMGEMQNAPFTMQRWIMANPVVREKYNAQLCDGYSGTYVDMFPGTRGMDHYDFRQVMDSQLVENEDGWEIHHYFEDLIEGDRQLSFDEKIDILSTWDIVAAMMKEGGEDPTSVFGSKL